MKSFKLTLMTFVMIAAATATSACSEVETSTPAEAQLRSVLETEGAQYVDDLETALSTKDGTQDANGAGQCCWGHCNNSNAFYSPTLSSGCRDWVVAVCHNSGLAFNPSGDAWWGTCL
jgi:hypothetical protein